jgi:co-chaperonin GroES (HSP10)
MLEIESLYGVEVIVHFEALGQRKSPGGVLLPQLNPDWMEATVIAVGSECKKGLKVGDHVIINKQIYNESPVLSSNQFKFPTMPKGEFKIMTEYLIAMKARKVTPPNVESDNKED